MIDISVQKIVKSFEVGVNILDGITFDVNSGEHIGLLGKNGAGKTTLFRIIAGEISSDEGDVVIAPGKPMGLISQIPIFPADYTAEDVLRDAYKEASRVKEKMTKLEAELETNFSEKLLADYDKLLADYQRLGGYDMDYEVNRVANGLEIPDAQRKQLFSTLSGGEKTRINLARLILEKTDILLLDEPTNHLDTNAVEWLEDYISKFKGTVLIISHDRHFLDKSVTRIVEIANGKAEFYNGNYSFYVVEKERRFEEQLKKYEKEQAEAKRLQEAADRLYQWGTGNKLLMRKSFAIESRIERIVQTGKPTKEKTMRARFGETDFEGDEVLVMKGISKAFDQKTLFSELELEIKGGESIALIGDNGTGKSTLIKLIMGEMRPDSGFLRKGPQVKVAYLPQQVHFDHPERTLLDTMIYEAKCTPQTARNRLGAFKFSGEDVFKCVSDLSGGEKSRLRLCILMMDDINFLILDEPTNHLDIASREWIEDAVAEFEGTLLFVSHDRYFTNKFATRVWELANGTIRDFRGTYEEYREACAKEKKQEQVIKTQEKKDKPKKEVQKKPKPKSSEKLIAKLEKEIAALEAKQAEIEALIEEFSSDYQKLTELQAESEEINAQLEEKMEQWMELSE